MKNLLAIVAFTLLTMLCWGIYGPVLQQGQIAMHNGLRPFICVGLAYFIIAVIAPIGADRRTTNGRGFKYGL